MRPCSFYAKNYGKEGFLCEYEEQESLLFARIRHNKDFLELNNYCNTYCPKFRECCLMAGEKFRKTRKANVIINDYGDGKKEIVVYHDMFTVPEVVVDDFDRRRCFRKVNDDFLLPVKEGATKAKLEKSVARSGERAMDSFKGYAHANKWGYFFTFTFAPSLVSDRYKDEVVDDLWRKTQRKFKHFDKSCRILTVGEPHNDGARHFHALITFSEDLPVVDYGDITKLPQRTCKGGKNKGKTGFCTFTEEGKFTCLPKTSHKYFLVPYYDYGELQRSSVGDILFCLNTYPYGRNSCAILPGDDTNQAKVKNYLSCYMFKSGNTEYNKRRFYRTLNLNNRTKVVVEMSDNDIQKVIAELQLSQVKQQDKFAVYRNFNVETAAPAIPLAERMKR